MGCVYHASHVSEPVDVAIKVLTAERARDPRYLEAFAREVRSAAALNHPGIVGVHDFGTIDEDFEAQTKGKFAASSPYLVMELVSGGTLSSRASTMTWPELKSAMLMILDALAHAHARGLIHRDLKPGNIMIEAIGDAESVLKLTDFGLAHALPASGLNDGREATSEPSRRRILGTPGYMAPEQIDGRDRDLGPWTDLYALGCLVYRLSTGAPPFVRDERVDVLKAHLREKAPVLKPCFPYPPALHDWVARLIEKDPMRRYQRAADAAFALLQIDDRSLNSPERSRPSEFPDDETTVFDVPLSASTVFGNLEWDTSFSERRFNRPPPVVSTWRVERDSERQKPLLDVGLGLYGLRSIPLVGRQNQLDILWNSLRIADVRKTPRGVVLHGGPGVGKSRLAEAFCERAHELGCAHVLTAHYTPEPALVSPLAAMIRDFVRAGNLRRNAVLGRLRQFLPGGVESDQLFELLALSEMIAPGTGGAHDARLTLTSMDERYAAVAKFIEGLARERPVIVWLDDGHWSIEAIGFAAYLTQLDSVQAMVVVTMRDDVLASRDFERNLLDNMVRDTPLEKVHIDPLRKEEQRELVTTLLGLEPELAEEVLERAGGNPLFAIQLVGDWVDRGVLVAGGEGFRLRPGATAHLPDHIHEVWVHRVHEIEEHFEDYEGLDIVEALETASALGERIDVDEWRAVIRPLRVPSNFVEHLTELRLARINDDSTWSFVHGMFRESVARRARETGRWAQAHLKCVVGLKSHHTHIRGAVAERVGKHYFEAQAYEEALEPIETAAVASFEDGEPQRGLRLLALREEAMLAASIPQTDLRWADSYVLRARMLFEHGDIEESMAIVQEIERIAGPLGWKVQAKIDWLNGIAAVRRGNLRRARDLFSAAISQIEDENARFYADCHQALGVVQGMLGEHAQGIETFQRAIEVFDSIGRTQGVANVLAGMAQLWIGLGEWEKAAECLDRSRRILETYGDRRSLSRALNDLGDLRRETGQLKEAEHHYRIAQRLMEATGSTFVGIPIVNLALCSVMRGEFDEALVRAEEARRRMLQRGLEGLAGHAWVVELVAFAEQERFDDFQSALESVRQWLTIGTVERDIANFTLRAGSTALRNGWDDEAVELYEIARQQYIQLEDTAKAEEVSELIGLISF